MNASNYRLLFIIAAFLGTNSATYDTAKRNSDRWWQAHPIVSINKEHWVGQFTENCKTEDGTIVKGPQLPSTFIYCTGPLIDKPPAERTQPK
jgi:hypothetical protein